MAQLRINQILFTVVLVIDVVYSVEMKNVDLYNASEKVVILNGTNFEKTIFNDTKAWLVQFYVGQSSESQELSSEWKKLAESYYSM